MTSSGARTPCVVAVVVAYRPEPALFSELLGALAPQVTSTVIVDNARGVGLEHIRASERLELIDLHGNAGVAAAQNAGIRRAREIGATHVLLLDHDSVPAGDMTACLLDAMQQLRDRGERVAAVGAHYTDARHASASPFVVMGWWGFRRVIPPAGARAVAVSFLISSGSLVSTDAFDAVGLMDERLFIDYVDVEWCLRAGARGWRCFGVPDARLEHRLGDDVLAWNKAGRPFKLFGRTFPARSPVRHYYLFRNGCWLVLRGALPLRWKLLEARRLAACFAAFALFAARRGEQVRAMTRGVFDGLRGRMGPA